MLSFEVGMKSELLDRKLRLNLALYEFTVDGQQLVAVGGQYNTATLLNADQSKGYGFEADIDWTPTAHWLINLGGSYNHTEIDDPNLGVGPCGGGCTVVDPIVGGLARVDGNPLPHAPEWILNGIFDYRRPAGEGLFSASVDWAYDTARRASSSTSRRSSTAISLEIGARVGYAFADARYELAIFGRNLTDEVIVQNGIDFNNLTGMTNDPRTFGVEFVFSF